MADLLPALAGASRRITTILLDIQQPASGSSSAPCSSSSQLKIKEAATEIGDCLLLLFRAVAQLWPESAVITNSTLQPTLLAIDGLVAALLQATAVAPSTCSTPSSSGSSKPAAAAGAAAGSLQQIMLYSSMFGDALSMASTEHAHAHDYAGLAAGQGPEAEALLRVFESQECVQLLCLDVVVKTFLLEQQGWAAPAAAPGSSRADSGQQQGGMPAYYQQLGEVVGVTPGDAQALSPHKQSAKKLASRHGGAIWNLSRSIGLLYSKVQHETGHQLCVVDLPGKYSSSSSSSAQPMYQLQPVLRKLLLPVSLVLLDTLELQRKSVYSREVQGLLQGIYCCFQLQLQWVTALQQAALPCCHHAPLPYCHQL
jgi:hypothetical protein